MAGADLVWYGAAGDRTKTSISGFGILDDFRGVLVRDDFGGYVSYDDELAGVQQCLAHLLVAIQLLPLTSAARSAPPRARRRAARRRSSVGGRVPVLRAAAACALWLVGLV